ncbi:TetR/AcrR family transcriptional regulator [Glaciihabitans sp. INWT7]|uniref:TetR/AcrR family transcriptional regulator n=1 Tax=Glaciihabitans sp. INWT7 TaxID=2596912 RepID=UPI0016238D4B|nr:TetR/AcrR family transcriptional regulator [Glaciihabitans sp. INWT7]QNE47228.1 TetR/AcrR family transcriptional regulator [Glaciihabitans sp. INWT7]
MAVETDSRETPRARAKADRRTALLDSAARLFAERGFDRVSMEDLGSAAGVSGPAVYRHFPGKQSVLAALLTDVSQGLFDGGTIVVERGSDATATLHELIAFHVTFALANADVIRVQDRDLESLAPADQHQVRALQRNYVELWVGVLARLDPDTPAAALRVKAHATFGLINSTPHSGHSAGTGQILEAMARAGLRA